MTQESTDLSIIQRHYDLVKWYIPIINKLPKDHRFALGDRITTNLYDILDGLILARYAKEKVSILTNLNGKLNLLRYQTRLLMDFRLIEVKRYEYAVHRIDALGNELGGWLKQQQKKK